MITPDLFGNHPPGSQARGQKVRPGVGCDRQGELLDIQLDQRHTQNLRIGDPDGVERDIDAARLIDHGLQMRVHSLLVESVDLRRLGGSAGGNDVLRDRFDRCPEAPGEKERAPLARKGARDSTADCPAGSVDHRDLVLQQHLWSPFGICRRPDDPSCHGCRHHDVEKLGARSGGSQHAECACWAVTLRPPSRCALRWTSPVCGSAGVDTGECVDD